MLKTAPAVFAVKHSYQIMVSTTVPALFWVRVGDTEYFDESNGIMRSLSDLHRVCVPMSSAGNGQRRIPSSSGLGNAAYWPMKKERSHPLFPKMMPSRMKLMNWWKRSLKAHYPRFLPRSQNGRTFPKIRWMHCRQ